MLQLARPTSRAAHATWDVCFAWTLDAFVMFFLVGDNSLWLIISGFSEISEWLLRTAKVAALY